MHADPTLPTTLAVDPEWLRRFDIAGPRYTSYPTADRFAAGFDGPRYAAALALRRQGRAAGHPLSLYVHLPFCQSICYYCACNKVVTRRLERAEPYLRALLTEIQRVSHALADRPAVSHLHLGGGTPTFMRDEALNLLMTQLNRAFALSPAAERSIEVDPRTVDPQRLERLRAMGFNRLSLGIQDFESAVQRAVHREQSVASVARLVAAARELGFDSLNMDLIYGLPAQTSATFRRTVAQVIELRPDRIALYGYAHLPHRFKPQRRIDAASLPGPIDKIQLLVDASAALLAAGYVHIGMDHFALPHDGLAKAKASGQLHRSFQGYTTEPDGDQIGLGVSAISRIGPHYVQNVKSLEAYEQTIADGHLASERGVTLTRDDQIRRELINALMCQGVIDKTAVERRHGLRFERMFREELARLNELAAQGLVTLEAQRIALTALGWQLVRVVAMVFDRYQAAATQARLHEADPVHPVTFSRVL